MGSGWEGVDEGGSVACEGLEDVPSLFSRRGDNGAEGGEVLSGVEGSESAGDFHLHLHHAQRLFREVVGEGNVEVDEEAQDVVLELMQPAQQVLSQPSLGSPRGGLRKAGQLAVEREPFAQGVPEAGVEALEKGGVERAFAPRALASPPARLASSRKSRMGAAHGS